MEQMKEFSEGFISVWKYVIPDALDWEGLGIVVGATSVAVLSILLAIFLVHTITKH